MSAESQLQSIQVHSLPRGEIARVQMIADQMHHIKEAEYFDCNFDFVEAGERNILVISHDEKDAGYCILNWHPKYAFFRKVEIPEIQDLSIVPDMRRRGLASALIRYCENLARTKGCEYMGIGVAVNRSFAPAQVLYAQLGYMPDGNGVTYDRRPVVSGDIRPVDDQLCMMMVKKLESGK